MTMGAPGVTRSLLALDEHHHRAVEGRAHVGVLELHAGCVELRLGSPEPRGRGLVVEPHLAPLVVGDDVVLVKRTELAHVDRRIALGGSGGRKRRLGRLDPRPDVRDVEPGDGVTLRDARAFTGGQRPQIGRDAGGDRHAFARAAVPLVV
ncbi:MAG: hypothetical protein ACLUNV_09355 [Sutterella wadsworthensis]